MQTKIINNLYTKFNIIFIYNTMNVYNINTVKPLYKKLFFFIIFFLLERFSYKEVFTFPMILRINL